MLVKCPRCRGSGAEPVTTTKTLPVACNECHGRGDVYDRGLNLEELRKALAYQTALRVNGLGGTGG